MPATDPGTAMHTPTFTVERLVLGHFGMDGGGLFGIIPKKLWQRLMPADEDNRVTLAALALLVRGNGITMVIDAGLGDKLEEKQRKIFAVDQPEGTVRNQLAEHGVKPEDVTHFLYTHLHFDHAGGATEMKNGNLQPLFPKAAHYVSRAQLDWATAPSAKDRASYNPDNWMPVQEAGLLKTLDDSVTSLAPGIDLLHFNGHTPGMLCPVIQTETQPIFFAVDLFPTKAHMPAHYIAAFDNEPMLVLEEKLRIQEKSEDANWKVLHGHEPLL